MKLFNSTSTKPSPKPDGPKTLFRRFTVVVTMSAVVDVLENTISVEIVVLLVHSMSSVVGSLLKRKVTKSMLLVGAVTKT